MHRYRLLCVEDNPVNALIVEELLRERADIELIVEDDGARGLARALAWRPQLLLLDHELPDTTGPALLAELRAQGIDTPCVLISAHAGSSPGFDACWSKPLDFDRFQAGINAFLPRELSANAHPSQSA